MELYEAASLDEFVVLAMRILPRIVASDITSYNEVNVGARRVKSIMDSPKAMSMVAEHPSKFERLLVEENPLVTSLMADGSKPLKISDFLSQAKWHETRIYRHLYSRLALNFQMAFVLSVGPPIVVAFALNRSERDFSEEERARLLTVQAHMSAAYQNAIRLEEFATQRDNRGRMLEALKAGWIELDSSMNVSEASSMALDAFAEFFGPCDRPMRDLPVPIRRWIDTALTLEQPEPFEARTERATLKVTFFSLDGGRHISLMVERRSTGLRPDDLLQLGLTRRQSEVLFWLSQGKSNADISVILKISKRTVENHIAQITRTLGVSSRTQALSIALDKGRL